MFFSAKLIAISIIAFSCQIIFGQSATFFKNTSTKEWKIKLLSDISPARIARSVINNQFGNDKDYWIAKNTILSIPPGTTLKIDLYDHMKPSGSMVLELIDSENQDHIKLCIRCGYTESKAGLGAVINTREILSSASHTPRTQDKLMNIGYWNQDTFTLVADSYRPLFAKSLPRGRLQEAASMGQAPVPAPPQKNQERPEGPIPAPAVSQFPSLFPRRPAPASQGPASAAAPGLPASAASSQGSAPSRVFPPAQAASANAPNYMPSLARYSFKPDRATAMPLRIRNTSRQDQELLFKFLGADLVIQTTGAQGGPARETVLSAGAHISLLIEPRTAVSLALLQPEEDLPLRAEFSLGDAVDGSGGIRGQFCFDFGGQPAGPGGAAALRWAGSATRPTFMLTDGAQSSILILPHARHLPASFSALP